MAKNTKWESSVNKDYKIDRGRKRPKYRQGDFNPINPSKCINIQKGKSIEYRSQLEFKYMMILDQSDNVISWGSEILWIPYMNPIKKRKAQYWVDFIVKTKNGVYAIEIKPHKEIKAVHEGKRPKMTKRKKKETFLYEVKMYEINKAKWIYANDYCEAKGWKFIQLSEKNIEKGKPSFL